MEFSAREKELLMEGLHMKRNFIETGSPLLCANDLRAMGKERQLRNLTVEQARLVAALDDLIDKIGE